MSDDHDQLDPSETLMREVGAQLRQVRLERGEELDEVAQQLRIKSAYLFGIEQGDLSTMPGRTYALGFLRSYADYLGFDGDDLINQIKSTVADLTDRTRLRMRAPLPESRLPRTPILVLSLAAVAGIYAGWSYVNRGGELMIETVAEVPANLRDLALGALREDDGNPAPPPPAAGAGRAEAGRVAAVAAPTAGARVGNGDPAERGRGAAPAASNDMAATDATRAPSPPPAGVPLPARLPEATANGGPGDLALPAIAPEAGPEPRAQIARVEAAAPSLPATPPPGLPAAEIRPGRPTADPTPAPQTVPAPSPPSPPAAQTTSAPETVPAPGAPGLASGATPAPGTPGPLAAETDAAPADLPSAPDAAPADWPTGPDAVPAVAPAPDAGASPGSAPGADVSDPAPWARGDQIAALPFDPAIIRPVGQVHEPGNADARVVLQALDSTWIQITSLGGDYLRDRTLERGDVFLVPNRPDLELWTGNAGGLQVVVDGTVMAPLGADGAIVRAVPLDPPSLRGRFERPILR